MKIVLSLFGIALFMLIPFMEFFIRYIVLGIIMVFLLAIRYLLYIQEQKSREKNDQRENDQEKSILYEMKENKRNDRILLVYFLIGVVIFSGFMQLHPMRRSVNALTRNVMAVTPLGMDIEDAVEAVNARRRWGNIDLSENWQVPAYDRDALHGMVLAGDTVVGVRLGTVRYFLFLRYEARAIWIFDEHGELMDVVVRKDFQPFRRGDIGLPGM